MATIVCPYCHTPNRAIAKFCIECIHTLPEPGAERTFVPTARAALMALGRATEARTVAIAALPCTSKGLWVGAAALGLVLCFGATGWYVHSARAKAAQQVEAARAPGAGKQAHGPRAP